MFVHLKKRRHKAFLSEKHHPTLTRTASGNRPSSNFSRRTTVGTRPRLFAASAIFEYNGCADRNIIILCVVLRLLALTKSEKLIASNGLLFLIRFGKVVFNDLSYPRLLPRQPHPVRLGMPCLLQEYSA